MSGIAGKTFASNLFIFDRVVALPPRLGCHIRCLVQTVISGSRMKARLNCSWLHPHRVIYSAWINVGALPTLNHLKQLIIDRAESRQQTYCTHGAVSLAVYAWSTRIKYPATTKSRLERWGGHNLTTWCACLTSTGRCPAFVCKCRKAGYDRQIFQCTHTQPQSWCICPIMMGLIKLDARKAYNQPKEKPSIIQQFKRQWRYSTNLRSSIAAQWPRLNNTNTKRVVTSYKITKVKMARQWCLSWSHMMYKCRC